MSWHKVESKSTHRPHQADTLQNPVGSNLSDGGSPSQRAAYQFKTPTEVKQSAIRTLARPPRIVRVRLRYSLWASMPKPVIAEVGPAAGIV
jgi:hypothetical protein